MEQRLYRHQGQRVELHVQDYASQALKWLGQVLPPDRIHHVGDAEIGDFDLIYMSAVDYAMTDDNLIVLIESLRGRLRANGALLMISASFLDESFWQQLIGNAKEIMKWLLEKAGIRHRGQFWGWMRTRKDYHSIMRKASIVLVSDGFIETPHQKTYWIKGAV